jgi:hypothetical protein
VDHQNLTFALWLGIALLALVWANLSLWRRRRALNRVRQSRIAASGTPVSSVVAELTGSLTAP